MNIDLKDFDNVDKVLIGQTGAFLVAIILPITLSANKGDPSDFYWLFGVCIGLFVLSMIAFFIRQLVKNKKNKIEPISKIEITEVIQENIKNQLNKDEIKQFLREEIVNIENIVNKLLENKKLILFNYILEKMDIKTDDDMNIFTDMINVIVFIKKEYNIAEIKSLLDTFHKRKSLLEHDLFLIKYNSYIYKIKSISNTLSDNPGKKYIISTYMEVFVKEMTNRLKDIISTCEVKINDPKEDWSLTFILDEVYNGLSDINKICKEDKYIPREFLSKVNEINSFPYWELEKRLQRIAQSKFIQEDYIKVLIVLEEIVHYMDDITQNINKIIALNGELDTIYNQIDIEKLRFNISKNDDSKIQYNY